ncbi:hypothetical protein [Desulfobulbus oligotrophicus]|uniref:Uncharacterized protein n=1 Tax=Desulfobulbus oligotrophicus TaxID=1909699 RepID=A0A7T5VEM2_9BACT|nr:hypothetical protein [Desulfobulbus oligotrophicus]QQG66354.1 hypothetical protein HP555_10985 [Desulfobulbus oligotrophicus]
MSKKWLDTPCLRAKPAAVDRESSIISGIKVCSEGEAKGHGVCLDSEFIETVRQQGAAAKRGVKARFGHPNMCSESLGTFIGRFKNFSSGTTVREDGSVAVCCFADLHLSLTAREAPAGDLYAYVISMAENEADMFGTSVVFSQGNRYRRNEKGEKVYPRLKDGRLNDEFDRVGGPDFVECKNLIACDCVDDPAANDGLFSADAGATVAGRITEFLDLHPHVFQILENNPEVIEALAGYGDKFDEFFTRYRAYRAKQKQEHGPMKEEKTTTADPQIQQTETLNAVDGVAGELLAAEPLIDVKAEVAAALKADRQRQADIRDLGRRFGFDADAEIFANSDKSLSDFQTHILAKSPDAWKASLAIKNPAQQETESDSRELAEGSAVVAKIKEKRKARFGN